jgi:hypothetical protein
MLVDLTVCPVEPKGIQIRDDRRRGKVPRLRSPGVHPVFLLPGILS